jgi:membrane fusion protein (multidrug efflux system)
MKNVALTIRNLIPAVGLLSISVGLVGCGADVQSNELSAAETADTRIPVIAAASQAGEVKAFVRGTAVLEAREATQIVAEAAGLVTSVSVEEGDQVQKGQILATLDTERAQLELARARAELARLEGVYQRHKEMVKLDMATQESLEQFEAEFRQQRAALELAELSLDKANIRAPYDGVITERLIKVGQQVQNFDATFGIADFTELEAVMNVSERDSARLAAGHRVAMSFLALPDDTVEGHVKRVSPVVDAATGTVRVTVAIDNDRGQLRPGMLAELAAQYEQRNARALIPSEAIVLNGDRQSVFVIEDGIARRVPVATGLVEGDQIEITAGLDAGQLVVVAGQNRLDEGSPVALVDAGP